jgi:hypothetical protein
VLGVTNALALVAGLAFGPVYAAAGPIRTWTLRILFVLAALLQVLHVGAALAWFFILWASFGIGGRIRRRIENPSTGPVGDHDLAAYGRTPDRPGAFEEDDVTRSPRR